MIPFPLDSAQLFKSLKSNVQVFDQQFLGNPSIIKSNQSNIRPPEFSLTKSVLQLASVQ